MIVVSGERFYWLEFDLPFLAMLLEKATYLFSPSFSHNGGNCSDRTYLIGLLHIK
jgi:hypothetical protein